MYLKIIIQFLAGITGLLALYIDHKWHDRRTNRYKVGRDVLFILSGTLILIGIITTKIDDDKNDREKKELNKKVDSANQRLNDLKDTLFIVKENSNNILNQITPFLSLAKSKYPTLSTEQALIKLQNDLIIIKEDLGKEIKKNEEDEKFKHTPPDLDIDFIYTNEQSGGLKLVFHNKVPILFNYSIKEIPNDKVLAYDFNQKWRVNPASMKGPVYTLMLEEFKKNVGNRTTPFQIKLTFQYQSYSFEELQDEHLIKLISKYYLIDPIKSEIKKL
jgi:hypothetical protein